MARRFDAKACKPYLKLWHFEGEPIKNLVTGEEHRARIVLPNGFEYKEAEMGNTVHCRVNGVERLAFELKNTYAQLNAFDWSN